ncbi:VOC family protein [Streptomyces sp. TP-A0356]|uniref:VOC family protein n=1 Tax=Streptomyces sp. TP-A0356 TaxID=1359208 RepID=UPI0006E1F838|nr:VOC family protein [Streptomyces sp. TP-A0356]
MDNDQEKGPAAEAAQSADAPTTPRGPVLGSVVLFVRDLERCVDFYRELLLMKVTVRSATATLLVGTDDVQLYLRDVGANAEHFVGSVGVQYVVWVAAGFDDLRRCERVLKGWSSHIASTARTSGGFSLVEGRDPSGIPVVVVYPGADQVTRREILSRIYA